MSTREHGDSVVNRLRSGMRVCIVGGSFAALAMAGPSSCGDGRHLEATSRAGASDLGVQVSPLTSVPKVACSGQECPPPPLRDGGVSVNADAICIQSCIDQDADALGACAANCSYLYPSASQRAKYVACRSDCEASFGAGVSKSCQSWRDCNGTCVDSATDADNCGTCGKACPPQTICTSGSCRCPGHQVSCSIDGRDTCVDLNRDPINCGSCGHACASGETCSSGLCCGSGQINCGGACTACPAGGVCSGATCGCPSGQTACGGVCNTCPVGGVCVGTTCVCPAGQTNCGGTCTTCPAGGVCLGTSCGCPSGEVDCGGRCTSLLSDSQDCGACGNVCTSGSTCVNGACVCPSGQTSCGGRCTSLLLDSQNCGACGNACRGGTLCVSGTCTCPAGAVNCGGTCTFLQADPNNCGACGKTCNFCCNGMCGTDCGGGMCCQDFILPFGSEVSLMCCPTGNQCRYMGIGC
jgi:Stigma-specific protein, Stig1